MHTLQRLDSCPYRMNGSVGNPKPLSSFQSGNYAYLWDSCGSSGRRRTTGYGPSDVGVPRSRMCIHKSGSVRTGGE